VLTRFRQWCSATGRDRHTGGMFGLQEADILAFVNRPRQTATGKAKPNTVRMELTVLSGPNRRRPEGDVSRPDGMHQSASGGRKGAP
jgi:hypothetical protein